METMEDYLVLLEKHDDPHRPSCPAAFDLEKSDKNFKNFYRALTERLKSPDTGHDIPVSFEDYNDTQDASYFGTISIGQSPNKLTLWISNFGDFYMTSGTPKDLPEDSEIRTIAAEFGYVFLPNWVVQSKYTGVYTDKKLGTWGDRYFSYV